MDEPGSMAELRRLRARVAELEHERMSQVSHIDDLQQFYRTAPVGLCLMDVDLRFVHINEMLAAIKVG